MTLPAIADQLATALGTITGLRVHAFVPDALSPPAGFIGWPEVAYDSPSTCDYLATFPIFVVIAAVTDRTLPTRLLPYLDDGAGSVRAALQDDYTLAGTVSSVRVTTGRVEAISFSGIDYLAARFDVECQT